MFCSKCGKKINETDNYCSLCGQVNTGNKETSKENKKRFDWKLILVVFFVLLFAKVLGSAFGPSTSYLETEVSGWTEEYESAYMNSCRKTRAQSIGVDSEIHPQVVSYCHCTLEEWKNLFPERPPSLSELERHGRIIYELCNWFPETLKEAIREQSKIIPEIFQDFVFMGKIGDGSLLVLGRNSYFVNFTGQAGNLAFSIKK